MKGKRILALDAGRSSIKVALLEGQAIAAVRFEELPPSSDRKVQVEALRGLLKGLSVQKLTQVVSVVDDPSACVREVLTPPMPAAELREAVRWELQRFLAVPPTEMAVDYESLGESGTGQRGKMRLLAAAFPAASLQEHLSFLGEAGVRPGRLVPKTVAIAEWVRHLRGIRDVVALLELGHRGAEFVVVRDGRPLFSRKIPVGGSDLTRAMTAVLMTAEGQVGLSEAEAETVKRGIGIPGDDAPERVVKGISKTQMLSLLRGGLERLAVEVERSLAFCGESDPRPEVGELLLIGGGAHLKGLDAWLERRLGIRVTLPDLPAPSGGLPPTAALSFIPALGASAGAGQGINLLPVEWKGAARMRLKRTALTGITTAAAIGFGLVWVGMQVRQWSLAKEVAALRVEKEALESQLPAARAALSAIGQLQNDPSCEALFRKLSLLIPPEIVLTELALQEREVRLRGRIRRDGSTSDQILGPFLKRLREGLFAEVQLKSSRQIEGTGGGSEFEVGGRLP